MGLSHPLTESIRIAGDISWSKIDGAPASGGVEACESTGGDFFCSLQLIGSGMIKSGDISSVGLRHADTQDRDTYTFTINTRYPLYGKLLFKPRLQIDYRENKIENGASGVLFPVCVLKTLGRDWRFDIDGEYRYAVQELEGIADGKDDAYGPDRASHKTAPLVFLKISLRKDILFCSMRTV